MDINYVKQVMKEKKITQLELSKLSGVPFQTVKCIFTGRTLNPRIDTVEAIEKALGISQAPKEENELLNLINQLNEEEIQELSNYVDYIISKRK